MILGDAIKNLETFVWILNHYRLKVLSLISVRHKSAGGGGVTLGISGWGCAARTLEPLAYTRASFSWILLPYTRVNSPNDFLSR